MQVLRDYVSKIHIKWAAKVTPIWKEQTVILPARSVFFFIPAKTILVPKKWTETLSFTILVF